ncbi:MAG: hypothetical protein V4655_08435, partial [Bdellovibrionota bacterium]
MEQKSSAQAFPLSAAIDDSPASVTLDWRSYFQMTKPTISLLVVVTVIPALFMTQDHFPSLEVSFVALLGTFLASGSAAVF